MESVSATTIAEKEEQPRRNDSVEAAQIIDSGSDSVAATSDPWPAYGESNFYSFVGSVPGTKGSVKYRCKHCCSLVTAAVSSTSNLKRHYERDHKDLLKSLLQHIQMGRQDGREYSSKKRKLEEERRLQSQSRLDTFFGSGSSKVTTVSQVTVNAAVTTFIIKNMEPFALADSEAFQELIATLAPGRRVPDRKEVAKRITTSVTELKAQLVARLAEVSFVATAVDCWTSRSKSFLGVTCHWINGNFQRQSAVLACRRLHGRHTYDKLATEVEQIHQEYKIQDKVTGTVTDNGSNFVKAFRIFGASDLSSAAGMPDEKLDETDDDDELVFVECTEMFSEASRLQYRLPPHHRCAAHTLNLIAAKDCSDARNDENYRQVHDQFFNKIKDICSKQSRSVNYADSIKALVGRKFVLPNETRWNSLFDCVQSFLDAEEAKPGVLDLVCRALTVVPLRPIEKSFMREYCMVMKPLATTLDHLQGEKNMFMGDLIPTITLLKERMRSFLELTETEKSLRLPNCLPLVQTILVSLDRRFREILQREDCVIASCLHPRFKLTWTTDEEEEVKIRRLVRWRLGSLNEEDAEAEANKEDDFYASFLNRRSTQTKSSALDAYLNTATFRDTRRMREEGRRVQIAFQQYNTCLPTSASVERLFSAAGRLLAPTRANLSDAAFEAQLLLNVNRDIEI